METKHITRGAMATALYAILLLLNQQTALTIELSAPWLFAFPILIYTAMHGRSISGVVAISMALMTFLFVSFTTWFYLWMGSLPSVAAYAQFSYHLYHIGNRKCHDYLFVGRTIWI